MSWVDKLVSGWVDGWMSWVDGWVDGLGKVGGVVN